MGSPLMFENVDPSMVQDATSHQLEAADDLEVKRRRRHRHPQTERRWRAGDPFGRASVEH